MRRLNRSYSCSALLTAGLLLSLAPATPSTAQSPWAAEPTYRFAGRYAGVWTAEVALDPVDAGAAWPAILEQRVGEVRGTVAIDVGCDGVLSGQAQGQTRPPLAFASIADGAEGPRVLSA